MQSIWFYGISLHLNQFFYKVCSIDRNTDNMSQPHICVYTELVFMLNWLKLIKWSWSIPYYKYNYCCFVIKELLSVYLSHWIERRMRKKKLIHEMWIRINWMQNRFDSILDTCLNKGQLKYAPYCIEIPHGMTSFISKLNKRKRKTFWECLLLFEKLLLSRY